MTHIKRYDIINALIKKNDYTDYLEIGICNPADCFDRILCSSKVGIEPNPISYRSEVEICTSDEFFKNNKKKFDIIFIDGLHKAYQVSKDYDNSLKCLKEGGIIISHDNLPGRPEHATEENHGGAWFGTAWKATALLRMIYKDLEVEVLDTDCGLGVVRKGKQELYPLVKPEELTFDYYLTNRCDLLNITDVFSFIKRYNLPIDINQYETWDGSPFIGIK
jgi:hypothetical protein